MYELDSESEEEHKKIGGWIKENKIDEGLLCGELIKSAVQPGIPLKHFAAKEKLFAYLKDNPIDNAIILVKASRGMALESVIDHL
jgi:UDP-N-acetylmuramoyl-tripeptide--D-alanyl-D-alanine ligase